MKSALVLCSIVFLAALHHGNAIKCYSCSSLTDKNCEDPFNKDGIETQDGMETCVKTKGEKSGDQVVLRLGSLISLGKTDCDSETYQGVKGTACYCDTDLCNSATITWISFTLLIICIIFGRALY